MPHPAGSRLMPAFSPDSIESIAPRNQKIRPRRFPFLPFSDTIFGLGVVSKARAGVLVCMGKYFYPRHRLETLTFMVVLSVYCTKPSAALSTQQENKPANSIPGV